ncbi:amidohydrolase family protein [Paenibacillus kobensis]|uniref:amidohydrolase family protein n=1 Tax=Paenibacillus kobensis TaxID=59841 RepID=UPI000FDCD0BD|nr:amidohydrolase family protein [Paenibacillus kobensis]
MRIDAHQHYWSMSRSDYGWITPELPVLYRDYLPDDLKAHLERHNLNGTIVVQAAPTAEETEYLFALADRSESILGVVGWLDLFDPSHREQFERYRKHPKFVGFRIMIQDMPDANRVLEPAFLKALQEYAAMDVPVDLLVKSSQLEVLSALLEAVPGLRGVIDHIGKPCISEQIFEPWASQIEQAAKHRNIYCKISGMVTEADHAAWEPDHFKAYVAHVVRVFGAERVLFGTDWPVCLLAASYDDVVNVLESSIPEAWGEPERAKLYGDNAMKFYKLRTE